MQNCERAVTHLQGDHTNCSHKLNYAVKSPFSEEAAKAALELLRSFQDKVPALLAKQTTNAVEAHNHSMRARTSKDKCYPVSFSYRSDLATILNTSGMIGFLRVLELFGVSVSDTQKEKIGRLERGRKQDSVRKLSPVSKVARYKGKQRKKEQGKSVNIEHTYGGTASDSGASSSSSSTSVPRAPSGRKVPCCKVCREAKRGEIPKKGHRCPGPASSDGAVPPPTESEPASPTPTSAESTSIVETDFEEDAEDFEEREEECDCDDDLEHVQMVRFVDFTSNEARALITTFLGRLLRSDKSETDIRECVEEMAKALQVSV